MPREPKKKHTAAKPAATPKAGSTQPSEKPNSGPFPIVAIGASAGGLEAFSNLLRTLPLHPGFAIVFVPHLDPTRKSAMVELLSRTTRLPVLQAAENMPVKPNSVYVLPPSYDMTIQGGVLRLAKREAGRHHMPIDTFFRSLSEDRTTHAIGVILSGTANDGTQGLAAIKNEGGITFAHDSATAKYDGMPNSAVSAGVVDFVLSPEAIARELVRVTQPPAERNEGKDNFQGQEAPLKEIFRLLRAQSKVDFSDYKIATIRRRILRRMNINQAEELSEYVKLMVLFEELEGAAPPAEEKPASRTGKQQRNGRDQQMVQLKQELAATKEYLKSVIEAQEATNEELQSAKEEIQSGNEELQSTNEELQTSKEDLESANEELNTVNEEEQHRNQQLAQLSNDLINFLNSASIAMVMLGEDLRIRRYTPEAEKLFGFSEHDVGKPLTQLRLSIVDGPKLERWMLDVMRDIAIRSEYVQTHNGKSYRLRITPYRTLENKIEGVVVTLMDIGELTNRLRRVKKRNK